MDHRIFFDKVRLYLMVKYHLCLEIASFLASQVCLESNFGSSALSKNFSNFIGMKVPMSRPSTALNRGDSSCTFASYDNLYNCLDDLFLWITYRRPMAKDLEDLSSFKRLLRSYCPEKDYISKIEIIYNQFINSNS